MKKMMATIISLVLSIASFGGVVQAKEQTVKVQIAPFKTQIESLVADNSSVEFPLITYKDITYFPMTYDLCMMLGLNSGFDEQKGLYITKHYQDAHGRELKHFGEYRKNYYNKNYDATIPTYPIYLNGIRIDNSKEEYPLLNFRGVTYFPMTWRFAYEELNFDIEWSEEEYSFKLEKGDYTRLASPKKSEGNNMILWDKISVYDPHIDENGNVTGSTLLYDYWSSFLFDTEKETITHLHNQEETPRNELDRTYGRVQGEELVLTVKDKSIYCGDDLLVTIDREAETIDPSAVEYKTGEGSIIYLLVYFTPSKPPYTPHNEYILVKNNQGMRLLDWDPKNNFNGVFADNNGGYYIGSEGYSPGNMGRWSNSFSDIYYYTPGAEKLISLSEKYSDIINSITAIGISGNKLYAQAMWYDAQKYYGHSTTQGAPISAVNSGYYTIDLTSGELEKIYPYIDGMLYFAPNGTPYCFTQYARRGRIINLNTDNIIEY